MQTLTSAVFHGRQWAGRLRRVFAPLPPPSGNLLKLHLGCGNIDRPGFVNVDGVSRPHVHFVQRIDRLSRFASGSVDFVYVSHALEHFPHSATLTVLREWTRVLKKGGRLCLSVPDFEQMLAIYKENGRDIRHILEPLFGGQDYPFNFHHTAFDRSALTSLMEQAGLQDVREWKPGSDPDHDMPDWSGRSVAVNGRKYPISLNLEGRR